MTTKNTSCSRRLGKIRKSREELNEIKNKLGIEKLWSFSSVDLFKTSKYNYYLRYIKHEEPDAEMSIYGIMGGLIHDTVEKLYLGQINKEELLTNFESFWFMNVEALDIRFDRSDSNKNDLIKNKYYQNLKEFMLNHEVVEDKMVTEKFILVKVGDYYFQGYIDSLIKDKSGNIIINDWKTSTIYKGKDIQKKATQLLLYSLGVHQLGIPLNKIKACWNFMKYANVCCEQINGKTKIRQIERSKIGSTLTSNIKTWMKKLKYNDETIEQTLTQMIVDNSLDCLPEDIKSKYEIHDCYVYVDINEESIKSVEGSLIETVELIKKLTDEYSKTHDDNLFWDSIEEIKNSNYYFYNLCDYTSKKHKPFKAFLDDLESKKNGLDLLDVQKSNNIESSSHDVSDDASWLDELFLNE